MQRLALALVIVACSQPPAPPAPTKAAAPEPAKAVEEKKAPEVPPETKAEPPKPEKFADAKAMLATMPADVAGLADTAAVGVYIERVKGIPGVKSAELTTGGVDGFGIKLEPAVEVKELATTFGWTDVVAVSGDAKGKSFSLTLSKGEVPESKGKKITTAFPKFGAFRVEGRLTDKPAGKPSKAKAGDAVVYDMATATGSVQWMFFMREG